MSEHEWTATRYSAGVDFGTIKGSISMRLMGGVCFKCGVEFRDGQVPGTDCPVEKQYPCTQCQELTSDIFYQVGPWWGRCTACRDWELDCTFGPAPGEMNLSEYLRRTDGVPEGEIEG